MTPPCPSLLPLPISFSLPWPAPSAFRWPPSPLRTTSRASAQTLDSESNATDTTLCSAHRPESKIRTIEQVHSNEALPNLSPVTDPLTRQPRPRPDDALTSCRTPSPLPKTTHNNLDRCKSIPHFSIYPFLSRSQLSHDEMDRRGASEALSPLSGDSITRPRAPPRNHIPLDAHPSLGLGLILNAPRRLPSTPSVHSSQLRLRVPQPLRINSVPLLNIRTLTPGLEPDSGIFTDVQNLVTSPSELVSHPLLLRDDVRALPLTKSAVPTTLQYPSGNSQDFTSPLDIRQWLGNVAEAGDDTRFSSAPHNRVTFSPIASSSRIPASRTYALRSASLDTGTQHYTFGGRELRPSGLYSPPPPPRPRLVTLPPSSCAEQEYPSDDTSQPSPWQLDLHASFDIDGLRLRADAASEAVRRASLALCSCALLRDPDAIATVCEALRAAVAAVRTALADTPPRLEIDDVEYGRQWYSRHSLTIQSVHRHLSRIYQLADQIDRRPPRIHRLQSTVEKLQAYEAKFIDLARRITLSHERLRIRDLKEQLEQETHHATGLVEEERMRRHAFRAAWYESREKRRELRALIRLARRDEEAVARALVGDAPDIEDENASVGRYG
ncbi:hypothetical protein OBBRIDRAFT_802867 [Obba rivulosa]|uniref:Uncharacterized protein n=1 Tax=Obba rivulosa TaxID=1052685 RepID=A0A8E2DN47_9APHY|nr:hypothetical protein OBBRIDRAFT_802867 [Obba rivulosa]